MNALYKFQDSTWNTLVDKIPSLKDIVESTTQTVGHLNSFIGINIGEAPFTMLMAAIKDFSILGIILAVIIPIMAGLTQFISVKPVSYTHLFNSILRIEILWPSRETTFRIFSSISNSSPVIILFVSLSAMEKIV